MYYGRPLIRTCDACEVDSRGITWDDVRDSTPYQRIIASYFSGSLCTLCLTEAKNPSCRSTEKEAVGRLVGILLSTDLEDILTIVADECYDKELVVSTIPQFSDPYVGMYTVPRLMSEHESLSFRDVGELIDSGICKKDGAKTKYGEQHAKLSALLDLTHIKRVGSRYLVSISPIGESFMHMEGRLRDRLLVRLIFRIPIIRTIWRDVEHGEVFIRDMLEAADMTPSTAERRSYSIMQLFEFIRAHSPESIASKSQSIHR